MVNFKVETGLKESSQSKKVYTPRPEIQSLLFDAFQITTNEKKRMQAFLLGECVHDVKLQFNERVDAVSRSKRDEINRIQEKNERIQQILEILGVK